jgi:presenilin 1
MGRASSAQVVNTIEQQHTDEQLSEAEQAEELRFYVQQIYHIVKPVLACILLSIFWVKVANSGKSDYRPAQSATQVYDEHASASFGERFLGSLQNALIIIGQIIVMTIVIACLFKYGKIKILVGFFMFVVAVLLGFMGYLLELNLLSVFYIPMDYITLSIGLWNFTLVGLVMVFWDKSPLKVQQVYLTVMSSLMAFSLTGLAEWTTWILLGLLSVWDLIAVLCPFGPLKMLIESSKQQNREVPALLYSGTCLSSWIRG